jgi:hypothetical protein
MIRAFEEVQEERRSGTKVVEKDFEIQKLASRKNKISSLVGYDF